MRTGFGLSVIVSLLACGGAGGDAPVASAPPVAAPPPAAAASGPTAAVPGADPSWYTTSNDTGFISCGKGQPDAPIYVTVSLNVNEFIRPTLEGQAVRRFLDTTARLGIDPLEVSFTGEVLGALLKFDPAAVEQVKQRKPVIHEHYRLIDYTNRRSTERELFWTDPRQLTVDRSRPGGVVLIQKTFGVTPRDNGGVVADMFRRQWKRGPTTEALRAAGVKVLNRDSLFIHPDRVLAAAIGGSGTRGHSGVDAYIEIYSLIAAKRAPTPTAADVPSHHKLLVLWAQVAGNMGVDLAKIPGLSRFADVSRLGFFTSVIEDLEPAESSKAAVAAALTTEPDAVVADMKSAFEALLARTSPLAQPSAELTNRLAMLPDDECFLGRMSWHASDDFTVERWADHMIGEGRPRPPLPLGEAATRPANEMAAIARTLDDLLAAVKANPRVRIVGLEQDTQWDPANSPEVQYPAVLGVSFADVPGVLDPAALDAKATAMGITIPVSPTNIGKHRENRNPLGENAPAKPKGR